MTFTAPRVASSMPTAALASEGEPPASAAGEITRPVDRFIRGRSLPPTHSFDVPEMLALDPPRAPTGFDRFWRTRYAAALRVAPSVSFAGEPTRVGDHDVHVVHYSGVDGQRLGGYLALPRGRTPDNAVLYVHGYDGCGMPSPDVLRENSPTTAMLFTCIRGFGLSATPDVPSNPDAHVLQGIESPETYELAESVADVWSSASALLEAVPGARRRLYLDGTSFGGGVSAMALAWDRRFTRAFLEVPTFGDQQLRMALPTHGSGAAVQRYAATPARRAQAARTLSYFDAATAATFARVPTMVAAARQDPMVTPPGQFAIYNGLRRSLDAAEARLYVMRAGHSAVTEAETEALTAARRQWFAMTASSAVTE